MNNLKPCPFCGDDEHLSMFHFDEYDCHVHMIVCQNCKTTVTNKNVECKDDLIKLWNRRTE